MEILRNYEEVKKLQNLFSWAQFYQNSDQLSALRYPKSYYYDNKYGGKFVLTSTKGFSATTYIPEYDQKRYDKCQEEIKLIGNK